MIKRYSDLVACQKAMNLVEEVYKVTRGFPKEEIYGLTSQARRAAVSVPSNIAEGQSRGSREFIHFLSISHGSLCELETQMLIAMRLGYMKGEQLTNFTGMAAEVGRLINGLSNSIEKHVAAH